MVELFEDLKQFISAEISQKTAHLATKDDLSQVENRLDTKIDTGLARLDNKIDGVRTELSTKFEELHGAIESTAITYTSEVDVQVQDHEHRIKKLEQKTA